MIALPAPSQRASISATPCFFSTSAIGWTAPRVYQHVTIEKRLLGRLGPAIAVSALCACTVDSGGLGYASAADAFDDASDGTSDSGLDDSAGSGTPALDLPADSGASGSAEGGDDDGCQKVDLLFVIDNSGSMHDNQVNLIASFPSLVQAMQDSLVDVDDYHVGVVGTDDYFGNEDGCQTIGALVTQTQGEHSSASTCGPFVGGRYMTDDEPDLAAAFSCAAQMGSEGADRERPMEALFTALNPAVNPDFPLDGCNDGFLRDDALLVIVLVTDTDDEWNFGGGFLPQSPGEPDDWFEWVVAAKGGVETNISLLALIGTPDDQGYAHPCENGGNEQTGTRIIEFVDKFSYGSVASVCTPDYGEVFEERIGVIESACEGFIPPG